MKTLTVRLPDPLVAQIDAESRRRRIPKSDVVRERLQAGAQRRQAHSAALDAIADLVGSVNTLPVDLSGHKKAHLRTTGYGGRRSR